MVNNLKLFFIQSVLKDQVLIPLVCSLMFLKRYLLLDYGYNYEEGKEIECVINILNGKLVFRDFWWQYGPGPLYFIALLSKLVEGPSFLLGRIVVTIGAVLMTFYAYRVSRFYLPASWAFWAALLASSGLASREGTYGHIFAYLGMIGSWYYLLIFFRNKDNSLDLVKAGLFVFMALMSKPIVFGVCSIAAGIICLGYWAFTHSIKPFPFVSFAYFLASSVIPSGFVYGYLYLQTPTKLFLAQLFPMTSGSFFLSDLKLKPLLPPIPGDSLIVWKNQLNHYLVDDFRWWTVFLTLIICLVFLIKKYLQQPKERPKFLPLFSALVYGFLIESETLILLERPITFFINMLPNLYFIGAISNLVKRKIK